VHPTPAAEAPHQHSNCCGAGPINAQFCCCTMEPQRLTCQHGKLLDSVAHHAGAKWCSWSVDHTHENKHRNTMHGGMLYTWVAAGEHLHRAAPWTAADRLTRGQHIQAHRYSSGTPGLQRCTGLHALQHMQPASGPADLHTAMCTARGCQPARSATAPSTSHLHGSTDPPCRPQAYRNTHTAACPRGRNGAHTHSNLQLEVTTVNGCIQQQPGRPHPPQLICSVIQQQHRAFHQLLCSQKVTCQTPDGTGTTLTRPMAASEDTAAQPHATQGPATCQRLHMHSTQRHHLHTVATWRNNTRLSRRRGRLNHTCSSPDTGPCTASLDPWPCPLLLPTGVNPPPPAHTHHSHPPAPST
jgi:hypothetical protein